MFGCGGWPSESDNDSNNGVMTAIGGNGGSVAGSAGGIVSNVGLISGSAGNSNIVSA